MLTPDDLSLRYNIGFYELFVRRPREAAATLEKVSLGWVGHTNPMRSWPSYFLAQAHHRLGEYQKELAVVRRAREHFPDALELCARQVGALAALDRVGEVEHPSWTPTPRVGRA